MSELAGKRWAKALMELAQEDNNISKESILNDLKEVVETIKSSKELSDAVNNPSISTEEKQIVICKLFQNRTIPIVYNFLFVLNLRKRFGLIEVITEEFEKELEKVKNIVRVQVTSAIDLSEEKKAYVKDRVAEKLQKDIKINWNQDSDIIGGLVFNINDTIVDNSIKHKLDNISKTITKL